MAGIDPPVNDLVAALVDQTGVPVAVRCLEGYLGPTIGGTRRLYLDTDMRNAAEFPAAAIRFYGQYRPAGAAVEKDVVWVIRTAVTSWSRQAPEGGVNPEKDGGGDGSDQSNFR